MAAQMQFAPWHLPEGPNVQNALAPLTQAVQSYRQGMDRQFEGERALVRERQDARRLDMAEEEKNYQRKRQMILDIGNAAIAADSERDPQRRAIMHEAILSRHPNRESLPPIYHDPVVGPRLLRAETGKAKDELDEQFKRAQISLLRSRAMHYRNAAEGDQSENWIADQTRGVMINKRSGDVRSYADQAGARADPMAGVGLDEDGTIVGAPVNQLQRDAPSFSGSNRASGDGMPAPMRLGGPRDDIDASMRLDEGRSVPGPRVAQAPLPGARSSPMDMVRLRTFGEPGRTVTDVPGIVTTTGRTQRMDVPATREAHGQSAYAQATPEQQERLLRLRKDQQYWASIYGPARAGYYYGPDGRELLKTDKNYKGDKEAQAVALLNLKKLDAAADVLLGKLSPRPNNPDNREGGPTLARRLVQGTINQGEVGQGFADYKQAAMGIAYALSGKTVAVAEMRNFMEAYGPTPLDTHARIVAKTKRLRQFHEALLAASRGGDNYETAFAKAAASMGVKNPDGSSMGAPSAAAAGQQPASPNDPLGLRR